MAISWPFDSTVTEGSGGVPVYSRTYSANVLARILQKYFRNGVFNDVSTGLQVVAATSGMSVKVNPGDALINGRHFYEESVRTLSVTAANATLPRIDTVVARLSLSVSVLSINLYMVTGTAAASPVAPTLTRNSGVWELGLANLSIPAGATSIPQAKITDTRLDSARCGVVASIIGDTDTTAYYAQVQSALSALYSAQQSTFNSWFASLETTLSGDVAGNLLTLINDRVEIGQVCNPNLLDNAHFLGPVNLAGVVSGTTYATGGYFLNRWWGGGSGNRAWVNGLGITLWTGASLSQYMEQNPNDFKGKTFTFSVMLANGSVVSGTGTFPSTLPTSGYSGSGVALPGVGTVYLAFTCRAGLIRGQWAACVPYIYLSMSQTRGDVKAMKLELGDISTLAVESPPDYAAELAKCQRYYQTGTALLQYSPLTPTVYAADHRYAVPMRASPSLKLSAPRYFSNNGATGVTAQSHSFNNATGIKAAALSAVPAYITTPLLLDYVANAEV